MTQETGWTHEQELLLQNWGEKAEGLSWLHKSAEKFFEKKSLYITVPMALLSGVSSSVQFSLINDTEENFWVKLGTALTTFSVTILSVLQKSLNFQSKEEQHRKMAIDFSSLYRDISAELSIPATERQNSKEYIAACRTEMDKLMKASPNIPDHIIKDFNKRFSTTEIHKPNVAAGITPIVLYSKSARTEASYKDHYEKKLHMQRTFYQWKAALPTLKEKNAQDQVAITIDEDKIERKPAEVEQPTKT